MTLRNIPVAVQDRRRDELTSIRLQRRLTDAELREEERLEKALYTRTYRGAMREQSQRLAQIQQGQRRVQPLGFA